MHNSDFKKVAWFERLGGWMRLWVLVSGLWLSLSGIILYQTTFSDYKNPPEPYPVKVWSQLSKAHQMFYNGSSPQNGPFLKLEIRFKDGATREILIEEAGFSATDEEIARRLTNFARDEGTSVDKLAILTFQAIFFEKRKQAIEAAEEYKKVAEELRAKAKQDAWEDTLQNIRLLFLPPFLLYIIGAGIGWVLRGFRKQT